VDKPPHAEENAVFHEVSQMVARKRASTRARNFFAWKKRAITFVVDHNYPRFCLWMRCKQMRWLAMQKVSALLEDSRRRIDWRVLKKERERKREREREREREGGIWAQVSKVRNSISEEIPSLKRFGKQPQTRIPGKGRKAFSGPGCWNKLGKTTYLPVAGRKTTLKYDSRGDLAPLV